LKSGSGSRSRRKPESSDDELSDIEEDELEELGEEVGDGKRNTEDGGDGEAEDREDDKSDVEPKTTRFDKTFPKSSLTKENPASPL
jgi:hypothetical protein